MAQKIISGKNITEARAWEPPSMGAAAPGSAAPSSNLITAAQIEQVQQQAYEEAYAVGLEEGRAAGLQQAKAKAEEFERLLHALTKPFEELDETVEQELVALAVSLVRQLVRRELRADPGQIIAVVREAMGLLPVASRNIRVHLHPEDAALVREALSVSDEERAWSIVEDPVLSRGGCKVTTDYSQVDASLETRLTQFFAQVFGGQRESDRKPEGPDS